ncbi:MAG: alpha-amylase/4-alpha-glucanotransferase domain-containing protein [Candidatus Muiribacteriaceae bacterium]
MKDFTDMLFVVHNHQPFGNFDNVIDSAFRRSYRPFIDTFDELPDVSFSMHISGPLLLWIRERYPEYIDTLKNMIERGQLTLLGGTYSEAILSVLAPEERMEQLNRYRKLLKEIFNINRLSGFWLTERVFTPDIIRELTDAGYKYTFVDDTHIRKGNLLPDKGLYVHEYLDRSLLLIPVSRYLRYNMPFVPYSQMKDHIREKGFIVHGDDGEKFGDWPGMYEFLYEKGHLRQLIRDMKSDDIRFSDPDSYISACGKPEKVSIPYSSYDSMNRWSMPVEELIRIYKENSSDFIEHNEEYFYNGNFLNFFRKYEEIGLIYRKNLYFCEMFRNDSGVYEELLRSQCCCAYWHGVFGGCYLPHMRDAVDKGNAVSESRLPNGIVNISDKFRVIKDNKMSVTVTDDGGSCPTLFLFSRSMNLFNSFARRPEFYHKDIREPLYYDEYVLNSFRTHIISRKPAPDDYLRKRFGQQSDIGCSEHVISEENWHLRTENISKVLIGEIITDAKMGKEFYFDDGRLICDIAWEIYSEIPENPGYIMVELFFHNVFGDSIQEFEADSFVLEWEDVKIRTGISEKCDIIMTPVHTSSIYHQDVERIQQCYAVCLFVPVVSGNLSVTLSISE